jgi:hypothetical protein
MSPVPIDLKAGEQKRPFRRALRPVGTLRGFTRRFAAAPQRLAADESTAFPSNFPGLATWKILVK